MSCLEVWCIHAHDVRLSVAIWYSDPSKFARLFGLAENTRCGTVAVRAWVIS